MKNFYIKNSSNIAIVLSLIAIIVSLSSSGARLGATSVLSTATSDTLETFRTNVNTSLSNLSTYGLSTTTANTFTATQNFSAIGVSSTTPLGNIGIGSGTATSSVSGGKFCFYFKDEADRGMFIKLSTSGSQVFSTSTASCL